MKFVTAHQFLYAFLFLHKKPRWQHSNKYIFTKDKKVPSISTSEEYFTYFKWDGFGLLETGWVMYSDDGMRNSSGIIIENMW